MSQISKIVSIWTQMLKVKFFYLFSLSLSLSLSTTNLQHLIASTHRVLLLAISPSSLLVFLLPCCLAFSLSHQLAHCRFGCLGLLIMGSMGLVWRLLMWVVVSMVVDGSGGYVGCWWWWLGCGGDFGVCGFFLVGLSCSGFGWVSLVLVWNFHSIVMVVVVDSCGG